MYLYLLQREPDIDHAAPIIYLNSKIRNKKSIVVLYNWQKDIDKDYRFSYLKSASVDLVYWNELKGKSITSYLIRFGHIFLPSKIKNFIFGYLQKKFNSGPEFTRFVGDFVKEFTPSIIFYDEAVASVVLKQLNTLHVKKVCFPTGITMDKSRLEIKRDLVYPFTFYLENMNRTKSDFILENTKFIENLRYSYDWQLINADLLNHHKIFCKKRGAFKVCVFGRTAKGFYRSHPFVSKLIAVKGAHVVFKDKPRGFLANKYNSIPSAVLISWADVVVSSLTSVIMDAIYKRKLFFYAKFISPDDEPIFDEYFPELIFSNENDLLEAIIQLKKGNFSLSNMDIRYDSFYKHVIFASKNNVNSFDAYNTLFNEIDNALLSE